jgi:hypothetical protein
MKRNVNERDLPALAERIRAFGYSVELVSFENEVLGLNVLLGTTTARVEVVAGEFWSDKNIPGVPMTPCPHNNIYKRIDIEV